MSYVENSSIITPKNFPLLYLERDGQSGLVLWSTFLNIFYVLIEFFNQYEALPPHGQHLVEEYFGNADTNKKLEIQAAFVAESESFSL